MLVDISTPCSTCGHQGHISPLASLGAGCFLPWQHHGPGGTHSTCTQWPYAKFWWWWQHTDWDNVNLQHSELLDYSHTSRWEAGPWGSDHVQQPHWQDETALPKWQRYTYHCYTWSIAFEQNTPIRTSSVSYTCRPDTYIVHTHNHIIWSCRHPSFVIPSCIVAKEHTQVVYVPTHHSITVCNYWGGAQMWLCVCTG